MRYYKYHDEYSEIAGGTTYIETEDGWALRQLTINGERYLASNINDQDWGMNLAEGQVDYDEFTDDQVTEIPEEAFEVVWNAVLATHDALWRQSQIAILLVHRWKVPCCSFTHRVWLYNSIKKLLVLLITWLVGHQRRQKICILVIK